MLEKDFNTYLQIYIYMFCSIIYCTQICGTGYCECNGDSISDVTEDT